MTPPPRPRRSSARSSRDPDPTRPVPAIGGGKGRGRRKTKGEGRPRKRRWRYLRRAVLALFVLGVVGVGGLVFVLAQVPLPEAELPVETSFIYYANGDKLAELNSGENRVSRDLDEMSDHLIDAVLAAEDKDFFSHNGVDARSIVRATLADVRGKPLQGGSTITQQYAKVVFTNRERSLMRKLKEATLAVKLEQRFEKKEILERYLNVIYFGRGAYGAQAASQAYFGVDVADLDVAQASYLAGLIRAPESADANRPEEPEQAEAADDRRNIVLRAMELEGHLTEDEVQATAARPVSSYVLPRVDAVTDRVMDKDFGTEYFVEYVKQLMIHRYGETRVYGGGLQIHTTLDRELQVLGYASVYGTLDEEGDPSGALVSIDAFGHVKAMVGGKGFAQSQVNLAVAQEARVLRDGNEVMVEVGGGLPRQVGSTFKPFVLAEFLRQGYTVESMIDAPASGEYPGTGQPYSNYDERSHGRINLIEATRRSSNTPFVPIGLSLGIDRVIATAQDLGVTQELPVAESIPLGSGEVAVLDMADAYLTFATRGEQVDPVVVTRVTDAEEVEIDAFVAARERVLEENQADIINDILQGVVRSGTGRGASIGRPVAGKTGTTQLNADAWFVGYTPSLSTAVWIGHPEGRVPMGEVQGVRPVTGGTIPAEIFSRFMSDAVTDERYGGDFVEPESLDGKLFGGRTADPRPRPTPTTPPSTTTPPATQAPPPTQAPPTTTAPTTTTTRPPPTTSPSSTIVIDPLPDPPMTIEPQPPPTMPSPPTTNPNGRPRSGNNGDEPGVVLDAG